MHGTKIEVYLHTEAKSFIYSATEQQNSENLALAKKLSPLEVPCNFLILNPDTSAE